MSLGHLEVRLKHSAGDEEWGSYEVMSCDSGQGLGICRSNTEQHQGNALPFIGGGNDTTAFKY